MAKPRFRNLVIAKPKTVSLVPWSKSSYLSSLLRLNKAVFAHAFGNECRIRVHTQPNILKSGKRIALKNKVPGNKTKEATKKIFLSTRTKGWKLALDKPMETEASFRRECTLDKLLETKAEFRHKQKWRRIWYREKPDVSLCGKSFSSRKKLGITEEPSTKDLGLVKTNMVIWGLIIAASTRAAVYLGQNYTETMAVFQNMQIDEIMNLFSITQRLVLENVEEMKNVRVIDSSDPSRVKPQISHPQAIKWTKAEVHVYADSVLCLAKNRWTSRSDRKMDRAAEGSSFNCFYSRFFLESMERPLSSSGNIFSQDLLHWNCFERFRRIYSTETLILRNLKTDSTSCLCSTTLIGTKETMKKNVFHVPKKSEITREDSCKDIGRSLDQARKKNGMVNTCQGPKRSGTP